MSNLKNKTGKSALIAMIAVICMIFSMTNEVKAGCPNPPLDNPNCPFIGPNYQFVELSPGCIIMFEYCYRECNDPRGTVLYHDIFIGTMQLAGSCNISPEEFLARYEEFVNLCFKSLFLKDSDGRDKIHWETSCEPPPCPEKLTVFRVGNATCVGFPIHVEPILPPGHGIPGLPIALSAKSTTDSEIKTITYITILECSTGFYCLKKVGLCRTVEHPERLDQIDMEVYPGESYPSGVQCPIGCWFKCR